MNILLTNDDGIHALGIMMLANRLKEEHNIMVVAPDSERSACSHSITLNMPLSVKKVDVADYDGIRAYSANGTPADCVKLATSTLFKDEEIDLIISGINLGANLGTDIVYSGTVHAALEGAICGFPSIAVSQRIPFPIDPSGFRTYCTCAAELTAQIVEQLDPSALKDYIYNINYPPVSEAEIQGIKVCEQGVSVYDSVFQKQDDPFGREYYWICAVPTDSGYNEEHQTDVMWSHKNYITVTPLLWNKTYQAGMQDSECNFSDIKLHY